MIDIIDLLCYPLILEIYRYQFKNWNFLKSIPNKCSEYHLNDQVLNRKFFQTLENENSYFC